MAKRRPLHQPEINRFVLFPVVANPFAQHFIQGLLLGEERPGLLRLRVDALHAHPGAGVALDEPRPLGEVLPRDGVRAAARRIGAADLAVADRDDGEEDRDRDRDLDREGECREAGEDQDVDDLVARIGGGRDRVRAEDRERELLGEALADLLLLGERAAEDGGPEACPRKSPLAKIDALSR